MKKKSMGKSGIEKPRKSIFTTVGDHYYPDIIVRDKLSEISVDLREWNEFCSEK